MKIGTITYHRAINYGAVLQTYALQKVLDKMGADSEVIDYRCPFIEWLYKPLCMRKVKNVKDFIAVIKGANIKKQKRDMFLKFLKNNVRTSSNIYNSEEELLKANNIYGKFITGSDQVWNFKCSNSDSKYFLDFVSDESKKYSYAASFGVDKVPDEWENEYKKLLSEFNTISVREKQGVKIVKDLVNKDAEEVLDPTLLLNTEDWKKLIKNDVNFEDYILIYAMKPSEKLITFAEELSKKTDKKIVFLKDSLTKENEVRFDNDVEYDKMVSPEEFVELFMKASYVITNSFHGTAFSINFNKQFFTELLAPETKVNSRLENILDMLGLRSRQILKDSKPDTEEIDYSKVNKILEEKKAKSMEFLKKILEN